MVPFIIMFAMRSYLKRKYPASFQSEAEKKVDHLFEQLSNDNKIEQLYTGKIDTQNIANYLQLKSQDQLESTFTSTASKNVLANNDIKTALNGILIQPKQRQEELEKLRSSIKPEGRAQLVISHFKLVSDEALRTIHVWQEEEKKALDSYVSSEKFKTSINNPEELETIKKSIIADLNNAHLAQIQEFNKSTTASLRALHTARKNEQDRIILLACLAENPKNRKAFKELAASKQAQAALAEGLSALAAQTAPETDPNIAHINIADLKTIYTFGGNQIHQPNPGTFHVEVGAVLNPFGSANHFMGKNIEQDFALMAASVKISGADKAVVNVNFANPELAEKRAKQAFKAFVDAGFPPEKIKLNINGKEKTAEQLFETEPHLLQAYSKQESTGHPDLSDAALHDKYSKEQPRQNSSSAMKAQLAANRDHLAPSSSPSHTSDNIRSAMN
ncbi:MAG: hypothetical protein CK426_03250 [Legionella sp.]|nr:MAG: hypothetical protein CK423_08500 [Legionella sp.]PJD99268.1 MAG: hypothetical protein CK426_03250 [Legionella sp.]